MGQNEASNSVHILEMMLSTNLNQA